MGEGNGYTFPSDRPERKGVRVDWTITMGDILTAVGGLVVACGAYVDYRLTVDRHEIRITANESDIKTIRQQAVEQVKAQTETVRAIDRLTWQLQTDTHPPK